MRQSTENPAARADIRRWPLDPSIVQIMLLGIDMVPTIDVIGHWVDRAFASPDVDRIRTGALFPVASHVFLDYGFVEADRLALLERRLDRPIKSPMPEGMTTSRLTARSMSEAADIDAASFPDGWRHDADSLQQIASATPQSRRRLISRTPRRHGGPVGFAITGAAGPDGYIQRLAVRPDARRQGAASALVDDALDWLVRRGAHRATVNTGTDNLGALDLYRRAGFTRLRDDLVVLELHRSA